jgi:hypothetical protein
VNPIGGLDNSTVLGYLKGGTSLDPDVVRSRCTTFVSSARTMRTFLLLPLVGGGLALLIGIPLSLIIIGIPILLMGLLFGGGAWWARRRLARNILLVEAVYAEFAVSLRSITAV